MHEHIPYIYDVILSKYQLSKTFLYFFKNKIWLKICSKYNELHIDHEHVSYQNEEKYKRHFTNLFHPTCESMANRTLNWRENTRYNKCSDKLGINENQHKILTLQPSSWKCLYRAGWQSKGWQRHEGYTWYLTALYFLNQCCQVCQMIIPFFKFC